MVASWLRTALARAGYGVSASASAGVAKELTTATDFDAMLSDVKRNRGIDEEPEQACAYEVPERHGNEEIDGPLAATQPTSFRVCDNLTFSQPRMRRVRAEPPRER
jgi:hypothetical protein